MKRFAPDDFDTLMEIIRARRDVRGHDFSGEDIDDKELRAILQAGMHAPSVGYSQPWKFVVIRDKALQRKVYKHFKKEHKKSKKQFRHRKNYGKLKLDALRETQTHIAVLYHNHGAAVLGQTSWRDTGRYSVAAAIQNIWLAARARNIGIGWVSIFKPDKLRKLLGIGKGYEAVGYLCVGKVKRFRDDPELKQKGWERAKKLDEALLWRDTTHSNALKERIVPLSGDARALHALEGKRATLMLALANTRTAEIKGLSQAGLPGIMHLTPTLDAELVATGKLKSLKKLPKTKKGIPTPALITRAVHLLSPFARIEALDLGLRTPPKLKPKRLYRFGLAPTGRIDKGAGIDARAVIEAGIAFGARYTPKGDYLILGESTPGGTTTAAATLDALGLDGEALVSSSFKHAPDTLRRKVLAKARRRMQRHDDVLDKLGEVSDAMLLFCAGFILGVDGRFPIVLAGGTQMATVALLSERLQNASLNTQRKSLPTTRYTLHTQTPRVYLITTRWVATDPNADIRTILEHMRSPIPAFYADFDFSPSHYKALRRYDKGEAKEGVGAGAAIAYAFLHGIRPLELTRQIEGLLR